MQTAIELKEEERTRCEVWTRVMGYHRPVSAFNPGKQSEHSDRRCFRESRAVTKLKGWQIEDLPDS
ncbi:MAG: oxidoreductase [gamma proteobacterium endosymbiont of Lamellibrachia anaximandri]|nr:oxidoreductase [gamma proteobacterium endosymbiont of Lamellibrachia anaximandri]MBL3619128.1 oxidoreductase [gamma proteobacterium endosymbiont of Lamellibrachia anaximandri]